MGAIAIPTVYVDEAVSTREVKSEPKVTQQSGREQGSPWAFFLFWGFSLQPYWGRVEGGRTDPRGRETPESAALPFSHRGGCGGSRNKIKQMKGVVELRKNNLFFMSLLTFVKLSKQKFMPFICMH